MLALPWLGIEVVLRILRVVMVGVVCICGGVWVCLGGAAEKTAGLGDSPWATTLSQVAVGNVTGKVVGVVGGVGIRKVVVTLEGVAGAGRQTYTTSTDAAGVFRFEGVAAGEYEVTLERAGFFALQEKAGDTATVTVAAGQEVAGLVYKMEAAGVISGKITEADGDPLQGVTVWVRRVEKNGGVNPNGPKAEDPGEEATNDLGEFRIANVRAGKYILQAQAHGVGPAPDPADKGKQKDHAIYALTYYPGTLDEKQAGMLQVTAGGTAVANFGVLTSRTYSVSGTVQVAGNPRNMQMFLVSTTGQTEAQGLGDGGKFEFRNITSGTYVAQIVDRTATREGQPQAHTEMIASPIVVSDADVTGLQLQPVEGGAVSGQVRTEDGETLDWANMMVSLARMTEGEGSGLPQMAEFGGVGGTVPLKEDGSFAMGEVAAGRYRALLGGHSEKMRGYYMKSVTQDGRDVADSGFTVSGETVLDVVVSAKGASIDGTVVDGNGQPVAGATVVSLPGGEKKDRMDLYQREKTDASGHFLFRGLSPGVYVVVGLEALPEDAWEEEFLSKYGVKGTTVDLDEGEWKSAAGNLVVEEKE